MSLFSKKIGTVFLKDSSDAEDFVNKMQQLSERASGELKDNIDKQIKLAKYGIIGENNIRFELKNSGMDMYVLHDIYLEYGEQSAQIDYMVFTKKRTYVLECKNLFGNITIDSSGNFVRQYDSHGRYIKEGIYSPVTQNERHLQVIKQIRSASKSNLVKKKIFESSFADSYKSLIVLANPNTVLNDYKAPNQIRAQVFRADQLVNAIRTFDDQVSSSYSNKDMLEAANFFLASSKTNCSDYSEKYSKLLDELSTCPICGSKLVLRTAKKGNNSGLAFWGCSAFPKCKYSKSCS